MSVSVLLAVSNSQKVSSIFLYHSFKKMLSENWQGENDLKKKKNIWLLLGSFLPNFNIAIVVMCFVYIASFKNRYEIRCNSKRFVKSFWNQSGKTWLSGDKLFNNSKVVCVVLVLSWLPFLTSLIVKLST